MAPFYGWVSTASRLEPLRGGSLLFTTKFPEVPGTHFIDLGRIKAESNLEPPSGFEHGTPGLGIQRLNHNKKSSRGRVGGVEKGREGVGGGQNFEKGK